MLTGGHMLLLRSRRNYPDRNSDDVMPLRSRRKTIPYRLSRQLDLNNAGVKLKFSP